MKYACRYLPISAETQNNSIYVIAGGYTHISANTSYPPTFHPTGYHFDAKTGRILHEFQLVYIAKGRGSFESSASGTHHIVAGTMFALFPGEWHRYQPDSQTGWHEYWIAFRGHEVHNMLQGYQINRAKPVVEVGVHERIVNDYLQLIEELQAEAVGYTQVIAAQAQLIMAHTAALSQRRSLAYSPLNISIEQAKAQLLTNYTQPFDFVSFCNHAGVNYNNFRREFKRITGFSPGHYHMQLRLDEACRLLQYTHNPVGQITQQLGFESIYYFSRLFKQKIGISPLKYRAQFLPIHET